ncbi:MAG TPA: hypothetical protein VD837_05165 [Terriglobales bacterium]|nr:hypothetical protein [Terriglobales bacterium]
MQRFQLLASPWWVNLLALVPFIAYIAWRRKGLHFSSVQLLYSAVFAVAFGFVEAAVVVYLRAAGGLLGNNEGLTDAALTSQDIDSQLQAVAQMPQSLMNVEPLREAATMFMLVAVALLIGRTLGERWAAFLWTFAIWDITYYVSLWATIDWPTSLLDPDVLFLIPVPWISQVWYPVLISALTLCAVLLARRTSETRV